MLKTNWEYAQFAEHVEIEETFKKGLASILHMTEVGPKYVETDVNLITNPKVCIQYLS